MLSNRLAIAALAAACIVAAGTGGYPASRHNATTPGAVAAASPVPSAPATPAPSTNPAASDANAAQTRPDDRVASEPPRAAEPPAKTYEELVVSADSVVGLQTENAISSELARVEDIVQARVSRDVRVGDKVVIPAGT